MVYRRLKHVLPPDRHRCNETDLTITMDDRVIWFKGGDHPDALYGEDVWAAVIDEATRCKEEAWHAVRTTVTATGGPMRIRNPVHPERRIRSKVNTDSDRC